MTYKLSNFIENLRGAGLGYALKEDAKETLRRGKTLGLVGLVLGLTSPVFGKEECPKWLNDDGKCRKWDLNGDGKKDYEVCVLDENNDGKVDKISSYEYDAEGKVIKETYDGYFYGSKVDKTWINEYDAKRNLIKRTYNGYVDGKADEISTSEYDTKNGNVIKETIDCNADGKADEIRTYEYDNKTGYKIKMTVDRNADGEVDKVVDLR